MLLHKLVVAVFPQIVAAVLSSIASFFILTAACLLACLHFLQNLRVQALDGFFVVLQYGDDIFAHFIEFVHEVGVASPEFIPAIFVAH